MTEIVTPGKERQMAVLFADISGSTRLYEKLGDTRAFSSINQRLDILRGLVAAHGGRVVKTIGDEIMAVFPDAASAVLAASEMQHEVSELPPVDGTYVAVRIGFHYGMVIESGEDGDVFGDTVNIAARMVGIAKSGQIITSGPTVEQLPTIMRSGVRALDMLTLKGKAEDTRIFEVIWQEGAEMTMVVNRTFPPRAPQSRLLLQYGGQEFTVDAQHPALTLGRGDQADLVIEDRRASRMHARIERRRDKFVFVDQSANGSFVTFDGENEINLHREEVVLRSKGKISLGHPCQEDPSQVVDFSLEDASCSTWPGQGA